MNFEEILKKENSVGENAKRKNIPFEIKEVTDEGRIEGYGSTFGGAPDSYGDVIVKGAFKESLSKGGRNGNGIIPMLWQHDYHEPIGSWPDIVEDSTGLKMGGDLVLEVQRAREAHALAKKKVINGLSIGWDYARDEEGKVSKDSFEYDEKRNIRYLKRIELWEVSPVTFAANTRATITNVKSLLEEASNERDFERGLRELGVSKSAAVYITSLCKDSLRDLKRKEVESNELKSILSSLKMMNTKSQFKN